MASLNRVHLIGNLTNNPKVQQIPSGVSVADLRLAVSEKYKNRAGEMDENVCFVDVVAWDRQADACGKHLVKGSSILVEGRLQMDEWEKDGQKRSRLYISADRIQSMGTPRMAPVREEEPPVSALPMEQPSSDPDAVERLF